MIVENPTRGQIISTEDMRVYGTVVSLPLNRPGILSVTPSSSTIIRVGKILFPEVNREAINISIKI